MISFAKQHNLISYWDITTCLDTRAGGDEKYDYCDISFKPFRRETYEMRTIDFSRTSAAHTHEGCSCNYFFFGFIFYY